MATPSVAITDRSAPGRHFRSLLRRPAGFAPRDPRPGTPTRLTGSPDSPSSRARDHLVAPVEQPEHRLQKVVAVGPTSTTAKKRFSFAGAAPQWSPWRSRRSPFIDHQPHQKCRHSASMRAVASPRAAGRCILGVGDQPSCSAIQAMRPSSSRRCALTRRAGHRLRPIGEARDRNRCTNHLRRQRYRRSPAAVRRPLAS